MGLVQRLTLKGQFKDADKDVVSFSNRYAPPRVAQKPTV